MSILFLSICNTSDLSTISLVDLRLAEAWIWKVARQTAPDQVNFQ